MTGVSVVVAVTAVASATLSKVVQLLCPSPTPFPVVALMNWLATASKISLGSENARGKCHKSFGFA